MGAGRVGQGVHSKRGSAVVGLQAGAISPALPQLPSLGAAKLCVLLQMYL